MAVALFRSCVLVRSARMLPVGLRAVVPTLPVAGIKATAGMTVFSTGGFARLRLGEGFVDLVYYPEIVLGMLQVILRGDPIPGRRGIPRKCLILFVHLICIAADPHVGAVAVEGLVPVRHVVSAAAGNIVISAPSAP